jgi:asparagine synthase (glutamine-hydrolysing)
MCGVAAIFGVDPPAAPHRGTVLRMLASMRHRGPDGCGVYVGHGVALGAVRLAINDVAHGLQPFVSTCGRFVCCYNGEIFNHLELRQELAEGGYIFRTNCDGEVIANLLSSAGEGGLERLDGQYSLIAWDRAERVGYLMRDEFGIVPLFYSCQEGKLLVASTLSAFFHAPSCALDLNEAALVQTCSFWSPVGSTTWIRQINSVLPGERLSVEAGKISHRARRFQVPSFQFLDEAEGVSDEAVLEEIEQSVRLRIPKEVGVGVYLSGGVDSALIAAISQSQADGIKAFSVTFGGSSRDEGPQQSEIAKQLSLEHWTVDCRQEDLADYFEEVVRHAEVPLVRTAAVGTFLLSRLAREKGVKVVLTGEGADEVFFGYDIYRSIGVITRILATGSPTTAMSDAELRDWLTRDPFARVLESTPNDQGSATHLLSLITDLHSSPFGPHALRWSNTSALKHLLSADLRGPAAMLNPTDIVGSVLPDDYLDFDPLRRSALLDFNTLLSGYLLSSQGDRMGMAHSIELRVPYLSRSLVQTAWRTANLGRWNNCSVTKPAVRNALQTFVGEEISSRPKKAYAAMDLNIADDYVWKRLEEYLSPETIRQFGLYDEKEGRRVIQERRQSRALANDFISSIALIASTHILAKHFTTLSSAAEQRREVDIGVSRELTDMAC